MIALYRPVLIESAEQAEALPIGTVAVHRRSRRIAEKVRAVQWDSSDESCGNRAMIRWMALVPIEAEEEHDTDCVVVPGGRPIRRLVTPWEEV